MRSTDRRKFSFRTSFSSARASKSRLASFFPGSKQINDLPNEILILVFKEGRDLDYGSWLKNIVHRRMRYPLMSVARGVCNRWKCIIDRYDRVHKDHFWFTFLRLSPILSGNPFAHQVLQFSQALARSQDCDLYIEFSLPWPEEAEDLLNTDVALLNLFTRSIKFLLPYQKQITSLWIDVSQPQFLGHLLWMFSTKLNNMSRCSSIVFTRRLPPLSYITSRPAIVPLDILANTLSATGPCHRISKVRFVGNGTLWDISWLDGRKMKFPFFVTHLEIPELSLHKNYAFFDTIRNELVSLTISSSDEHGDRAALAWDIAQTPLNTIDFPKLWHLCMSDPSYGSGWADYFLKNVSCPQLKFAKITSIQNPPFSSLGDEFDSTTQIPGFPCLQELTIEEIDVSQYSLSCLACLARPSVRKLRIGSLSFNGCIGSNRREVTDVLKGVFRNMCPLEISLDQIRTCEVSLLEVLDLSIVRELAIGDIREDITASLFPLPAEIKAPLLLKLEINTQYDSPFTLLKHFECISLTTLNLNITNGIPNDLATLAIENDDRIQTEVILGEIANLVLTARGDSKFPNLQYLHLIIRTRSVGDNEAMQFINKISASRHLNGATLLALQEINSSEIWIRPELEFLGRNPSLAGRHFMCWEHMVICKGIPIGSTRCQPKRSKRVVLMDKDFNLIDQADFNDARRITELLISLAHQKPRNKN